MTGIDEKAKEYVGGSDYADSVFGKSERHAYVSGAEYVIDKACKWLEENLSTSLHDNSMSNDDEINWIETVSVEREPSESFINRFRKAMEE